MQKKVIKRKKKPNYKKENYQRVNNKALTTGKIVALLAAISILLVTYMTLGIELTIIVAILLAIIYGVWSILERIKNSKTEEELKRIINSFDENGFTPLLKLMYENNNNENPDYIDFSSYLNLIIVQI